MADALYPKAKEAFLQGLIDMLGDTIKVALVDTDAYTYNAAHQFFSEVEAAVVGTPQTLGSKTVENGVFDAADVTFANVTGNSVEALVIYKDDGVGSASSPLIAFIDSGADITPNGGNINVTWDNGANKIFAL